MLHRGLICVLLCSIAIMNRAPLYEPRTRSRRRPHGRLRTALSDIAASSPSSSLSSSREIMHRCEPPPIIADVRGVDTTPKGGIFPSEVFAQIARLRPYNSFSSLNDWSKTPRVLILAQSDWKTLKLPERKESIFVRKRNDDGTTYTVSRPISGFRRKVCGVSVFSGHPGEAAFYRTC